MKLEIESWRINLNVLSGWVEIFGKNADFRDNIALNLSISPNHWCSEKSLWRLCETEKSVREVSMLLKKKTVSIPVSFNKEEDSNLDNRPLFKRRNSEFSEQESFSPRLQEFRLFFQSTDGSFPLLKSNFKIKSHAAINLVLSPRLTWWCLPNYFSICPRG